ncbi:hypothetical protein CLAIMM_10536 [Cladophialophora immunda]|nr:hypothetical protein CLAIMM_10536 [Cladophialophora immunda]
MAPAAASLTPGFASFQKVLSTEPLDTSTTYLVSLLKRRQIRGSKRCAVVTTLLLLRTVEVTKQADSVRLIQRVTEVGKKLIEAAPHEPAVGNIVRRVLGIIREEEEDDAVGTKGGDELSSVGGDADVDSPTALEPMQSRGISHAVVNGDSTSLRLTKALQVPAPRY